MSETVFRCVECNHRCQCDIIQREGKYNVNFFCQCNDKSITLSYNDFKKFLTNICKTFKREYHKINNTCSICLECYVIFINNYNNNNHSSHKHINLHREHNDHSHNYNKTVVDSFDKIIGNMNDLRNNISKTCKHLSSFITRLTKLENEYQSTIELITDLLQECSKTKGFSDFFDFLNEANFLTQFKEMNIYKGKEILNMLSQKIEDIKKELYNDNTNMYQNSININTTCTDCLIDVSNNKIFFGRENGNIDITTFINNNTYTNKFTIQNEFKKPITCLSSFTYNSNIYLLAGSNEPVIKLFQINNVNNSHSVIFTFSHHTNQINKIITSDYINNDTLTFYSCSDDCSVMQYQYSFNKGTLNSYCAIIEHNDYVNSICFSKDNTNVVSASAEDDKRIIFYDVESQTINAEVKDCYCSFKNGLLAMDNKNRLLSGGLNEIFVINTHEYVIVNIIKAFNNDIGYVMKIGNDSTNNDILICTNEGRLMKVDDDLTRIENMPYDTTNNMVIYDFTIERTAVLKTATNKGISVINI